MDVQISGRGELGHAGVVDEHVEITGGIGQLADVVDVGQVGRDEAGAGPVDLLDLGDDLGPTLRVASVDDDLGALLRKRQRGSLTDAGCGARDERDLACEFPLCGCHCVCSFEVG